MTPEKLSKATGASLEDASKYYLHLEEGMALFGIRTPMQRAALIATVDVESGNLSSVEESFYYKDAVRLAGIFPRVFHSDPARAAPYVRNHEKLGHLLYPDGFWGRGLIQLTWLDNYSMAGKALGFNYVNNPKLVTEPWHAAMTACWYFYAKHCVEPASIGDMDLVTERVNGPKKMHLAERKAAFRQCMDVSV
jgi:putative chitinase